MPLLPCLRTDARGLRFNNGRGYHVPGLPVSVARARDLRNETGTNSWFNFAGFWWVAVDTLLSLARSWCKYVCLAGCCGHPDVDDFFVADTASRVAV